MIPITKPVMGEAEAQAASRVVLSGWTSQGPEVAAFEKEFAALVGSPYACAVSNCTTALHMALMAVGVRLGDEVITVSHSFIATANSIRYCGATPVFIDIDPTTYNMDAALIEAAITERTRAILCVHQIGLPCDLKRIVEIGQRHHLPVIEDAACAIGSEILWDGRWEMVGRPHSDIACFSFHPRKVISTGDGGMLTTRHQNYDATFRLLRQHAMSVSDATRHSSPKVIFESYPSVGFNYRLTDIQAAVGREQLKRLPDIVAQRRRLADNYRHLLSHTCGLTLPIEPVWGRSNWQSYAVRMPHDVSQQSVMQYLLDAGVSSRRGIMCAHREQAYADVTLDRPLPHSEAAQDHCVLLPLYPGMSEAEQAHVAATLRAALESTTTPKNFRHQVNIAAFERM